MDVLDIRDRDDLIFLEAIIRIEQEENERKLAIIRRRLLQVAIPVVKRRIAIPDVPAVKRRIAIPDVEEDNGNIKT